MTAQSDTAITPAEWNASASNAEASAAYERKRAAFAHALTSLCLHAPEQRGLSCEDIAREFVGAALRALMITDGCPRVIALGIVADEAARMATDCEAFIEKRAEAEQRELEEGRDDGAS